MLYINPPYKDISWENEDNYLFLHPKQKDSFDLSFLNQLNLKSHIFITTSGTTGKKCIALSKQACLLSAQSVNRHLQICQKDRWLLSLPLFHIGGLSILPRSFLSSSSVSIWSDSWNPDSFTSYLEEKNIQLTSLVPTQLYDLILKKLKSPSCLRAVIVGGGDLHPHLYQEARKLNWPILPSYGLTEVGSQVATAPLSSLEKSDYPNLQILDHCQVKVEQKKIYIKSDALLTGWFEVTKRNKTDVLFHQGVKGTWFETGDYGEKEAESLAIHSREGVIKIDGKSVSMAELENVLQGLLIERQLPLRYGIIDSPDLRRGNQIDLVTDHTDLDLMSEIRDEFNQRVLPYERIENCYYISEFPRGSLSKIQIKKIRINLGFFSQNNGLPLNN